MSNPSKLWDALQRKEAELASMRKLLAAKNAENDFLKASFGERTRKVLPKDHPREEDTGRAVVECRICYQLKPQRAHRICHRCYNRMYYRKVTYHKKLGGKWISRKDMQEIIGRPKGGILPA